MSTASTSCASGWPPRATPSSTSTIAAAPAAGRISPKPSPPTGATTKSKICWPASTRPSRWAWPIPIASPSPAGATAASSPTTPSPAPIASRRHQRSGRGCAHVVLRRRPVHPAIRQRARAAMEESAALYQDELSVPRDRQARPHAHALHGRNIGHERAHCWAASRCTRRSSRWAARRSWSFTPASSTDSRGPASFATATSAGWHGGTSI